MTLTYQWLYDTVRKRFESDDALEAFLPRALASEALADMGDDRYLSAMTRRVFQAGMQHSVVDAKWPAFEEAFSGFAPEAMALLGEADIQRHLQDARLVRHRAKLQTIPLNARFILDVRREQGGSFGAFIADWPVDDIVGLWRVLARRAFVRRLPAPGRQGHVPGDQRRRGAPGGRGRHRRRTRQPARSAGRAGRIQCPAAAIRQAAVPAVGLAGAEHPSGILGIPLIRGGGARGSLPRRSTC